MYKYNLQKFLWNSKELSILPTEFAIRRMHILDDGPR